MINFRKVILHNFSSYHHSEFDLTNKGFCLVSGKNLCKQDNSSSNGAGKSTPWSAISFCLTSEMINGIHSNLKNINIDEDESYVTLYFSVDDSSYEITRTIAPKTALKIIKDGENISGKTFKETEQKLHEILPDLTRELLASIIIIGQSMPLKLSSFSPSGRKELLEKLTKSDFMIEEVKQRVLDRLTTLNKKIRDCEDSLLINNNQIQFNQKKLVDLKNEQKSLENVDYSKQIQDYTDLDLNLTKEISKLTTEISQKENQTQTASKQTLELVEEKSKVANEELAGYNTAFQKYLTVKSSLELQVKQKEQEIIKLKSIKDICPTCGQKIPGVHKPNTEVQEVELKELKVKLTEAANTLNKCNESHNNYRQQINESYDKDINQLKSSELKLKSELDNLRRQQNNLNTQLNTCQINLTKIKAESANFLNKKAALEKTINDLETSIHQQENLVKITTENKIDLEAHLATVRKMDTLIKRDFRGFLLENIIKYLDKKAKEFSKIVFNTDQLNVFIEGNNLNITFSNKQFDNLSGGEKQKVDLILQFAIRDLLNNYFNINSNILVLDEITDFLDKQSSDSVMKLLEQELSTIESVFIVSHHNDELNLPIDTELHIVKDENGISRVE